MLDFPSSPATGQTYSGPGNAVWQYDGAKWSAGAAAQAQNNNVGRNLLHNSMFNVQQRGAGPWTTNGYTLDRWWMHATTDTFSVTRNALTDGGRAQIGDEAATYFLSNAFVGNAAAAAHNAVTQPVEDVRRLSGKTVTVSFWAIGNTGSPKLGVSIDQNFGTGGSPSAQVNGTGQSVTLTSTGWVRYSLTFSLPSTSGMTLGTNNDHATYLNFWFSSGSTNATRSGNVGVQSNTISLWGVQLEIGSVATPLDKPDPQTDLARCQRFYQLGYTQLAGYTQASTTNAAIFPFPVQMRATPTIVPNLGVTTNVTSATVNAVTAYVYQLIGTGVASGAFNMQGSFTASADL